MGHQRRPQLSIAGVVHHASYRTGYIDQAILTFEEAGGTVTRALKRTVAKCKRALTRGIGPAKHSASLPLERLPEIRDIADLSWSGDPAS